MSRRVQVRRALALTLLNLSIFTTTSFVLAATRHDTALRVFGLAGFLVVAAPLAYLIATSDLL